MYVEEFLWKVADEYSLSFSELEKLFLFETNVFHNLNFVSSVDGIFEKFQKFVKGLGDVTYGSVIYYLRNLELERSLDAEKKRNHEMKKQICEALFAKDGEMKKLICEALFAKDGEIIKSSI